MKEILKNLFQKLIDDIDAGNTDISEEDELKIIDTINKITYRDKYFSKYQAYTFLNMSRATFDNKVRSGEIPHGIKVPGFKELMWDKKDLIKLCKK